MDGINWIETNGRKPTIPEDQYILIFVTEEIEGEKDYITYIQAGDLEECEWAGISHWAIPNPPNVRQIGFSIHI